MTVGGVAQGSTSISDSLVVTKKKQEEPQKVVEETKTDLPKKDEKKIDTPKETKASKNVDFVEQKQEEKYDVGVLTNPETGEETKFKVDEKGNPVKDKNGLFIPDEKGKFLYIKINEKGEAIPDKKGNLQFVEAPKETEKIPEKQQEQENEDILAMPLPDQNGEPRKVKLDKEGLPILNDKGELIDDPNGGFAYIRTDAKKNIMTDENGNVTFVRPNDAINVRLENEVKNSHTHKKVMTTLKAAAITGTMKTISTAMIKGGVVKIPFTAKVITGWGAKYASYTAAKTVTKTIGKELAEATVKTTEKVVAKQLIKETAKGAGVATVKALEKTAVATGEKTLVKALGKGMEKSAEKITTKALEKAATEGTELALKAAGKTAVEHLGTEGSKAVISAAEKAAVTAGTKGAAKGGGKLASLIPVAGAVAGGIITAIDAKDAWDKHHDPKATKTSRYLADATVFLDGVSTACTATGIGAPIGWVATGASVVTSVLSDIWRYKTPWSK